LSKYSSCLNILNDNNNTACGYLKESQQAANQIARLTLQPLWLEARQRREQATISLVD
jgi:hypothetical protein